MTKPLQVGSIAVYNAIEEYYSLEGHSPGIEQIMAMVGYASKSTVAHHLDRLEQAGWITREHKKVHAIVPVKYPRTHYVRRNPVAAGKLHAADDDPDTESCPACDRFGCAVRDQQPDDHTHTSADADTLEN